MACVSGLTGGVYEYFDCCGQYQTGVSLGESICIDEAYSGSARGVYIATGITCTQSCDQGPLSYGFQLTGLCDSTTGTVVFNSYGGIPPYTIDNIIPGTLTAQTSSGPITFTGLTGGTYVFRLNDSIGLQNNELYINVLVTDCFEANIVTASGTTCGTDTGYLSISATSSGSPYTIMLYKDSVLYDVQTTGTLPYDFNGLPSGIYYATVFDYGFTTANTENAIISASTSLDYGFWVVNTSNCVINQGKLAVTGLTGTGPYTYLWSNGETTQLITGLTQGVYTCTVTDSSGCELTKSEYIGAASPLGIGLLSASTPSCFASDGSLTYILTGGTAPFYYSASTAQVGYTLSNTFTLTNLAAGTYQVVVRDANFCETTLSGFLSPVGGFNVVDIMVNNSNCNQNNGEINVQIAGLGGYYTYILSGQNTNQVIQNTSLNQTNNFTNLQNDTYLLTISGSGTDCIYTTTLNVTSEQKFNISATTTGSTCGIANGIAYVEVYSGYNGVLDYVLSNGDTLIDTSSTAVTYNNLFPGNYTITVTDIDGCAVSTGFTITTAGQLVTSVQKNNCVNGNDGSASVVIYQGEPTFTYNWSNGQTGSTISGLSAGNYYVEITDSNGCYDIQYFSIDCNGITPTSYQLFNVCNSTFTTTVGTKRGLSEMLNEGYLDITSGYTGCSLNSAELICQVDINGSAYTQTFYTATTLNDVPQDTVWQTTIEDILSGIPQIQSYEINLLNNTLTIYSNCDGDEDPLSDADFSLSLTVVYDVTCTGTLCPAPPVTYEALYTSTSFANVGSSIWPLSGVESGTISYSGAPNEILTMRLTLPNLINFSGGTSINGINYDEYSANTFTASTNSSGIGTLTLISSATTHTNVYGQKIHYLEILNSSSGSTIGPPGTGSSWLRWRYTSPISGNKNMIGVNAISATTSGDACNNITYNTSYRIGNIGLTPNVGSTVYSGTTGANIVNGNNNWISVYNAPVPIGLGYYSGFIYDTKYVIQVDASGVITNVQTCP